jgi:uncharacterized protein (DUF983 family)
MNPLPNPPERRPARQYEMLPAGDDMIVHAGNSLNPPRPLGPALLRGLRCRCPACGRGRLFKRFLKLAPVCDHCGEQLHHARPDDAPPYFVMLIVGHIVVPLTLVLEDVFDPPMWSMMAVLVTLTCVLGLALLAPVKGAIVAVQWALWMHGFDPHTTSEPDQAVPATK